MLAIAGCSASSASEGDYPAYSSEAELTAAADAVILGEITGERRDELDGIGYRVVAVDVLADATTTFAAGDAIEVKLITGAVASPDPQLEVGDRYVLFLETYDSVPASLLNPWQAHFEVTDGEPVAAPDNDIRLSADLRGTLGLG